MKFYRHILFDLDGTLTDPAEGITASVAYALAKFGIQVRDRKSLYVFIGPPLIDSFMTYYGMSREEAVQAVAYYREYFAPKGIFENIPYDGIRSQLEALWACGRKLYVATSKPEEFALKILEHFDLLQYFTAVAGATMDETRTRKGEVIAYLLAKQGLRETSDILMVGDRDQDMKGAAQNGIDSLGVLYGYGDREELTAAGATYLCESVSSLSNMILSAE